MATVSVTNSHGYWEADSEILSRAIEKVGSASLTYLRQQAARACGFPEDLFLARVLSDTAFDDLSRIEVLIAWIDSGNHPF